MSEAKVRKTINAPVDKVWKTIRDFDGIDRYLPVVASCSVEGSGVGAKRTCYCRTVSSSLRGSKAWMKMNEP